VRLVLGTYVLAGSRMSTPGASMPLKVKVLVRIQDQFSL
jgi:hypothetical protein